MHKRYRWLLFVTLALTLALSSSGAVGQTTQQLMACRDFAYSTEEDFLTQGPTPADGNPIISDGDLLNANHIVCMRNRDLLARWKLDIDLGLDAVDVLEPADGLVAFSTELNDPQHRFTAGDLLNTWGGVIPNQVLLTKFQVSGDRGLDAVHFMGKIENIIAFNSLVIDIPRDSWLANPGLLTQELERFDIDIWFSIEGTERLAATVPIYDGDLLSARQGTIVARNSDLLPVSVPAGLPNRGVDFGLDAFTAERQWESREAYFSTSILYRGEMTFTDGDVIAYGDGIKIHDVDLYKPFEPKADFLGTDALYMRIGAEPTWVDNFLSLILKRAFGHLP